MAGGVIVLDFGAQYNHLIARRIRECEVFCEVLPCNTTIEAIRAKEPRALVLSGGPASVFDPGAPRLDPAILDLGIPILGICYGMQLMAFLLGGVVRPAQDREYGRAEMERTTSGSLFEDVPQNSVVWMSHGDLVESVPPQFEALARTKRTPIAAMACPKRNLWAVQYHPEVHHTPEGMTIFRNFLYKIAGLAKDWKPENLVKRGIEEVRTAVGSGRALVALSGGVDSAVAGAIARAAIGDRLTAVLIDHGLLREGEVEEVQDAFSDIDLRVVDAREPFFKALVGITDPEQKRKVIGREFIRAFERVQSEIGQRDVLIQGTVYPDVIESGGQGARTIKSHHNVGGLPEDLTFHVVEPLRWLFKDEVRRVGESLGLPESLIWRQPFPGPGLAVRIIGEVKGDKVEVLRAADAVVRDEIRRAGLERSIWQAFAVLLDLRSVGVMGDARTYGYPIVIRAVESQDGMTADWVRLPYDLLERMAARIVGEVESVNRVVYDITSKPPATIEWE